MVLSEDETTILVTGSVTDETEIGSYELILFKTDTPEETTVIATGTTAINSGTIGTISTDDFENTDYTLQLRAWDSQGNGSGMEVVFEYEETINSETGETEKSEIKRDEDTTIPVITGELEGAITEEGLTLTLKGTIADENLSAYTVVTGTADSENNLLAPVSLKTGTNSVENAVIAQYTYDKFTEGTYMMRVTAVDKAGNKRVTDFFIKVTAQSIIDDGYTGESGEGGEGGEGSSASGMLNFVLSATAANTGDTLKVYLTYLEEAADIRLTAEGAKVELYGRTADITCDTPGDFQWGRNGRRRSSRRTGYHPTGKRKIPSSPYCSRQRWKPHPGGTCHQRHRKPKSRKSLPKLH